MDHLSYYSPQLHTPATISRKHTSPQKLGDQPVESKKIFLFCPLNFYSTSEHLLLLRFYLLRPLPAPLSTLSLLTSLPPARCPQDMGITGAETLHPLTTLTI